MPYNSWRALFEAAVLEPDLSEVEERVKLAEQAIGSRICSLTGEVSREERLAMADTLSVLRVLKRAEARGPRRTQVPERNLDI
jgi:hypothetical protein